jgi:hypothetical protein
MWSQFAGMISTGNSAIPGWLVGPANKFVVEHQLNCAKEQVAPLAHLPWLMSLAHLPLLLLWCKTTKNGSL